MESFLLFSRFYSIIIINIITYTGVSSFVGKKEQLVNNLMELVLFAGEFILISSVVYLFLWNSNDSVCIDDDK